MLFFWEYFWTLNPDSETGNAAISHTVYFPLVDALYVVIAPDDGPQVMAQTRGRRGRGLGCVGGWVATGNVKRIVCLANSRKFRGRCVAAKEILANGTLGVWVTSS